MFIALVFFGGGLYLGSAIYYTPQIVLEMPQMRIDVPEQRGCEVKDVPDIRPVMRGMLLEINYGCNVIILMPTIFTAIPEG
jgi:hypothetical protein